MYLRPDNKTQFSMICWGVLVPRWCPHLFPDDAHICAPIIPTSHHETRPTASWIERILGSPNPWSHHVLNITANKAFEIWQNDSIHTQNYSIQTHRMTALNIISNRKVHLIQIRLDHSLPATESISMILWSSKRIKAVDPRCRQYKLNCFFLRRLIKLRMIAILAKIFSRFFSDKIQMFLSFFLCLSCFRHKKQSPAVRSFVFFYFSDRSPTL
jgi:hypothetical protein